jgi:sirohydrochlorin cobaltochelatase
MTPPPLPLLLAGHGSADAAGAEAFVALRGRVADMFAGRGVDVAGGFIELSEPPLSAAVDSLVARGHRRVVAVPVVLAAAGHAKGDVPAALAAARARHPGLSFAYGRPLGPHPVLLRLLARRISETLGRPHPHAPPAARAAGPQDVAVLVVGRGSTDPDANAETYKTSRLLWETHQGGQQRFALAETAFVSLARPDVAEGLERCRRLGARRIVVARYFLFPGVLPDRVVEQASGFGAVRDELDVRCAGVLGDCDEIAQLVAVRYAEALTGDIRMNCDMCVYRAGLPGFEHRVGAPQRPHYHPAEAPAAAAQGHVH